MDKHRENTLKWQKNNPEKVNAKQRRYYKKLKLTTLEIIGKSCMCCGINEWWNLTIDHIIPIKGKRGQSHDTYRDIVNGKVNNGDFQTLCFGCNTSKNSYTECKLEH